MHDYLAATAIINADHPTIQTQARKLAQGLTTDIAVASACFVFVRDSIRHSWDYQENPVTCIASDVLQHQTGYCFAKSHLLAALLRANQIPAALCYQRLVIDGYQPSYSLHGLNAVYLKDTGWYRLDARGNKPARDAQPAINARFDPPHEHLAFAIQYSGEADLPGYYAEPRAEIIDLLTTCENYQQVAAQLPDVVG